MRPDLLPLAASLSARGERFALVTVVRREPPSSVRVGDTALITESGEYHGWAGGGCTRETVIREAQRAMPPAITNAVVDALSHLGVTHVDIPITPEKVWQLLRKAGVAE